MTPEERDATLVLDPTRGGRQRLTGPIRAKLLSGGRLGDDAVTARVLEPRGLRRADTAQARSYQPGDVVAFRKGARHEGIRRHILYRVEDVDAPAGIVRLFDPEKGKAVDWQPQRWGADVV